jgi:prepilin-type N-terminal cleavage/methylation domain-containing protein
MLMRTFMHRPKNGFTLTEVLVALAILALVSAMVYPTVANKIRDARTASLLQTFQGLASGAAEYKRAVTRYPGSLTNLTTAPLTTSLDICGNQILTLNALWRGPYASREILASGLVVGEITIQPGLRRVTSGTNIYLVIDAPAVDLDIVNSMEKQMDVGTADLTTGTIRAQTTQINATTTSTLIPAVVAGSNTTNLSYAMPINSC